MKELSSNLCSFVKEMIKLKLLTENVLKLFLLLCLKEQAAYFFTTVLCIKSPLFAYWDFVNDEVYIEMS